MSLVKKLISRVLLKSVSGTDANTSKVQKKVYILSTGRTGTNFLAWYFANYKNVHAVHEPKPYYRVRLLSHAKYEGYINTMQLKNLLPNLQSLATGNDTEIYIESNPALSGFAEAILEQNSNCEVIHIVRDPRDFVKSNLNHGNGSGIKRFLNVYLPFWFVDSKSTIGKLNKVATYRASAYWKTVNESLSKLERMPGYHCFRFEDIFNKDLDGLTEIVELLGLELLKDKTSKMNKSKKKTKDSWTKWSEEEVRIVNKICSPLMQKYGYGNEPEWLSRLK